MKNAGCSLIYAKVTNLKIIKVAATSTCITHSPNEGNYNVDLFIRTRNRCLIKEANRISRIHLRSQTINNENWLTTLNIVFSAI